MRNPGSKWHRWYRNFAIAAVLAVGTHQLLRQLERYFLFFPDRVITTTPEDFALTFESVAIPTEDGETLAGWWIAAKESSRATILYCHGNAGNISDRVTKAVMLAGEGFDVLLFDYRGYGTSTGAPSEEGLAADARAAHRYLTTARGLLPGRLIVWGKSLGGAVAARLAHEAPAAGLIIESSFTRAADMAPLVVPWLPFSRHLVRSRFDTLSVVPRLALPKLFIHGDQDTLIPLAMGDELFARASGPKRRIVVGGAEHTDAWVKGGEEYRRVLREFATQATGR